jgi:hypothetical protein
MGPDKDSLTPAKNQVTRSTPRTRGGQRRARRPRRRVCLLKGCGRVFRPQQPLARYCSEACQAEARCWRQWKARRRYRQSPNGKQKRQAQSRRYRERRKEQEPRETAALSAARVIPTEFFFVFRVIARDATRSSTAPGDRPCNGSVPTPVVTRWNGFWSGSGAGANGARARPGPEPCRKRPCPSGDKSLPRSSGHIAPHLSVSLSSACAQGEEGGARPAEVLPLRSLFFFNEDEKRGAGISSTRA